jgi:hypothetical protein
VERADNPALNDRPEAFNRVGVDRADNVFMSFVADKLMIKLLAKLAIARVRSLSASSCVRQ